MAAGYSLARALAQLCPALAAISDERALELEPLLYDAWDRGQPLSVHGWVYGLQDGLVRDLTTVSGHNEVDERCRAALAAL